MTVRLIVRAEVQGQCDRANKILFQQNDRGLVLPFNIPDHS